MINDHLAGDIAHSSDAFPSPGDYEFHLLARMSRCYGTFLTSYTEAGRDEWSIKIPLQRAYTGTKPAIPSSLADTPCATLGVQGILDELNATLGTSYTLDIPTLSSVLEDCIKSDYDFGTAYGRLRWAWENDIYPEQPHEWTIRDRLCRSEDWDREERRGALVGNRIVNVWLPPRRVWDLCANRVVPWWSIRGNINNWPRPISHAWVDVKDRVEVWTAINGKEWPVPIPKDTSLDLIRIEMLNLGAEYAWLDVLCLRQEGGLRDDLRVEEWKLDMPTLGCVYNEIQARPKVVIYLSGLGRPLSLKAGDLQNDRCWFRRAQTLQEIGDSDRIIAGDTPDGPLHRVKQIEKKENSKGEMLKGFHSYLRSFEQERRQYPHMIQESVQIHLDGMDRSITIKASHLASHRWCKRVWTLKEISNEKKEIVEGDTPNGLLHIKPMDGGNYEDEEILAKFHEQLESLNSERGLFGSLASMQKRVSTNPGEKVAGLAFCLLFNELPAYDGNQPPEDAWNGLTNTMNAWQRSGLFFLYPEPGNASKKWRPSWDQVMTRRLPADSRSLVELNCDDKADVDWYNGFCIGKAFVRGLSVGCTEGGDRHGELIVKDAHGSTHMFTIIATHQYPIPEDTYALLGSYSEPLKSNGAMQYWVVGRLLPEQRFEKLSVFRMTDWDEIVRLERLEIVKKNVKTYLL
ncbi:uncharacterized protein BT62DRAFT_374040 [Guyanagaster necrorhizus]|uniref:Heterokaryon incompatibility domain-containing protein n=1 Tax=Guyanagaster necrorhizus TaxID=856835 RepID=A0A9P7VL95_9AGAR|nr:uncharacterized protein BT62DRAFT_374040 [Guyanagaster necrorhizus MCA 3950]KAG7442779.1 hypothetical protein BT62DRAFT_374040 [Guyanagaster necrorhizus MCA 3950]